MTYQIRHFAVSFDTGKLRSNFEWHRRAVTVYSSIAQSVEHAAVNRAVVGSSPTRGVFFDYRSIITIWLHGQAVKTSPFHGGNTGSIPVGVIKTEKNHIL